MATRLDHYNAIMNAPSNEVNSRFTRLSGMNEGLYKSFDDVLSQHIKVLLSDENKDIVSTSVDNEVELISGRLYLRKLSNLVEDISSLSNKSSGKISNAIGTVVETSYSRYGYITEIMTTDLKSLISDYVKTAAELEAYKYAIYNILGEDENEK